MQDKSTRFTLGITAAFIAILALVGWGLKKRVPTREAAPPAATVAESFEEPSEIPAGGDPPPSLPLDSSGKPVAEYEVLTGCQLLEDPGNDGDTFLLRTPEGDHRFCLYWVDAMETDGGQPEAARRMAQHFGFASEEPLRDLATEAREFSLRLLRAFPLRVVTRWEPQPEERAFAAYVYLMQPENQPPINLSEYIVRHGLAMIRPANGVLPDGTPPDRFLQILRRGEAEARQENRGGWKAQDL